MVITLSTAFGVHSVCVCIYTYIVSVCVCVCVCVCIHTHTHTQLQNLLQFQQENFDSFLLYPLFSQITHQVIRSSMYICRIYVSVLYP
jgi:hypothetical protein